MHGILFTELKHYLESRIGKTAWGRLLAEAGLGGDAYLPIRAYPDAHWEALIEAASERAQQPRDVLLEDFGSYLSTAFLQLYGHLLKPEWGALDAIEHAEATVHQVVRHENPGAEPPVLRCERVSPDELRVHYASERRLCALARGIARGVGRHFGVGLDISEERCALGGDPACEISVVSP